MGFQTSDVVALRESLEITSGRIERIESDNRALVRWEVRAGYVGQTSWHDLGDRRLVRRPLGGA